MRAKTGSYRRGRIPEATYQASVSRFSARMGVSGGDDAAGLARLHAEGVLTDEELAAARRRLLGT